MGICAVQNRKKPAVSGRLFCWDVFRVSGEGPAGFEGFLIEFLEFGGHHFFYHFRPDISFYLRNSACQNSEKHDVKALLVAEFFCFADGID